MTNDPLVTSAIISGLIATAGIVISNAVSWRLATNKARADMASTQKSVDEDREKRIDDKIAGIMKRQDRELEDLRGQVAILEQRLDASEDQAKKYAEEARAAHLLADSNAELAKLAKLEADAAHIRADEAEKRLADCEKIVKHTKVAIFDGGTNGEGKE